MKTSQINSSVMYGFLVFGFAAFNLIVISFHGVLESSQVLFFSEALGLVSLFLIFWSGLYRGGSYLIVFGFLFVSLILALIYVLPMPAGSGSYFFDFHNLPGRDLYSKVVSWLNSQNVNTSNTLSLVPYESTLALLALLAPLGIFFTCLSVTEVLLKRLIYLLLLIVGIQAVIGLIQYASGNPDFYFGIAQNGRSAQGSYVNRDHYSALLEMTLPMVIGQMLYSIGRSSNSRSSEANFLVLNQVLVFGFLALLIFLAAIFARSRMGVFLIMIAVLISSFVFSPHLGGRQSVGFVAIFTTVAVGLAASIGLVPVLNRFVSKNPLEDERFRIFEHTIEGITSFFPFGSGPGTFSDVYRAFQPIEQLKYITHAHNDYLELVFEMGFVGLFIIFGFLIIFIYGWVKLAGQTWTRIHFIKIGAGIGISLFLLHLLTDFLLHKPMNTMVFALLLGVFFRKPSKT